MRINAQLAARSKLDWRKGRRPGRHQRLVIWKKPARKPKCGALTEGQRDALPASMEVRLIRFHFEDQ